MIHEPSPGSERKAGKGTYRGGRGMDETGVCYEKQPKNGYQNNHVEMSSCGLWSSVIDGSAVSPGCKYHTAPMEYTG